MGIKGLLPLLKNIYDEINIDKYKGQKVAVDTYCWLHKAVFSCSYELVLGRPTTKHIVYCVNRVKKLLALGVTPVMVFDGARLEQKADEERERRKKRRENKEKGMRFLGKGNIKEATKYFQRAVDVKPEMAHQLITELRKLNVECIVAPYEADAQLAYLSITDKVSCVITEDSDLLVFGCKAVLFKMDSAGNGTEIRLEDLGQVSSVKFLSNFSFGNWTQRMLQEMCVLSGCDYLPSIPRIGLKKAYNLIHHYRNLEKAVRHLRHEGKYDVPDRYEQRAERAVLTFRHQLVFDPSKRDQTNLREIPSYLFKKELTFLGEFIF
ncbi:hypothetical protein MHBO_003046 [Bonamia ostreae]|uniref:Exonuclease 1 n=1 Tax=Bonamia ostreae TaxID=126728 RepID=A0ABV2APB4_9EUKA